MLMNNTLDNLIKERAPTLYNSSPITNLFRKLLMNLFKYDETAQTIDEVKNLHYSDVFKLLGSKYTPNVSITGLENIPNNGSALIVANHPMGPADAIALISKLNDKREKKVKIDFNKALKQMISEEKNRQLNQFSLIY